MRGLGGKAPLTDVGTYKPPRIVRKGIKRLPPRSPRPAALTERHLAVLGALGEEPCGQAEIARATGLSPASVASALYVLDGRGLARRLGFRKGWVRV